MEILIIIGVIALAVLFMLSLKLFHSILKAAVSVLLVALIVGLIAGVIIVNDTKDFKEEFTQNYSTYVLQDNGTTITGFEAKAFNFTTFKPVEHDELPSSPEKAGDDSIHVFVEKEALDIPESPDTEMMVGVEELLESEDQEMQARGFMMALTTSIMQQGPTFLFKHLQSDKISIIPQRPSFAIIEYTPKRLWTMAEEQFQVQKQKISKDASEIKNMTNMTNMTNITS
ncbi:MAG: hypothetical protein ACLFTH_03555 [Candidatus Woesearchaeota archaeon]